MQIGKLEAQDQDTAEPTASDLPQQLEAVVTQLGEAEVREAHLAQQISSLRALQVQLQHQLEAAVGEQQSATEQLKLAEEKLTQQQSQGDESAALSSRVSEAEQAATTAQQAQHRAEESAREAAGKLVAAQVMHACQWPSHLFPISSRLHIQ